MNKLYDNRTVWVNYPETTSPLNEDNLNRLGQAVSDIDDRVMDMYNTKLDKATAYTMVKSITFNESTGVFTITYLNGSTSTLDTKLEKLAVNFGFDPETEKMTITLEDGTTQEVDLSAMISKYNFKDSDTIGFTVDSNGDVVAIVKEGSIQGKHLQPDYLSDVTKQAAAAATSATNAATSETNAAKSAADAAASAKKAEEVSAVKVATTEAAGIVKPDGETFTVEEDGTAKVGKIPATSVTAQDLQSLGFTDAQGFIDLVAKKVAEELLARGDVVDNLLSTLTDAPLSAYQGNVLDGKITQLNNKCYTTDNPPTAAEVGAVPATIFNSDIEYNIGKSARFRLNASMNAVGSFIHNNDGTVAGGLGGYGSGGTLERIWICVGSATPWNATQGLSITSESIKWKNKPLLPVLIQSSAPTDTYALWIDTSTGVLKYHSGSAWVSVKGA